METIEKNFSERRQKDNNLNKAMTITRNIVYSYLNDLNLNNEGVEKAINDVEVFSNDENLNKWKLKFRKFINQPNKKILDSYTKVDFKEVFKLTLKTLEYIKNNNVTIDNSDESFYKEVFEKVINHEILEIKKQEFDKNNISNLKLKIHSLKNITDLEISFDISDRVVAVIGENGCGKSTLLTSISKVIIPEILKKEFKGSDSEYNNAFIEYNFIDKNKNKKSFKWARNQGWKCVNEEGSEMPRLKGIFESNVFFGKRFTKPVERKEEQQTLENKNPIKNSELISELMGEILYNDKNVFRSIEEQVFVSGHIEYLIYKKDSDKGFSQINWSSGEYLLFKILEYIIDINESNQDKSKTRLVIIDEVELSLHPLAQKRIIKYLKEFSSKNNLLVILTTHSPYIIKEIEEKNIYKLNNNNGITELKKPPLFIGSLIKNLTNNDYYDRLILVEDKIAKIFIKEILHRRITLPIEYKIIAIGGWKEVLNITEINKVNKIFNSEKVLTVLDGDVLSQIEKRKEELDQKLKEIIDETEKDSITRSIRKIDDYRKLLGNSQKISESNTIFLPIENIENYLKNTLLDNNKFIDTLSIENNLSLNMNDLKEKTDKKIFEIILKEIQKDDDSFDKSSLVRLVVEFLKEDNAPEIKSKLEEFKRSLFNFLK